MGGMFKLCPEIFYQIYTIQALNNNQVFPSVFALLPNKNEERYNRLSEHLVMLLSNRGRSLLIFS